MKTPSSLVRNAEEAECRWFYGGGLHRWLVREGEVDGSFLLFEDTVEAGKRTPLHTHPEADESFYLLDGSILLHIDGDRARAASRWGRGRPARRAARVHGPSRTARGCSACTHPAVARTSTGPPASPRSRASQPLPVDFERIKQAAMATGAMRVVGPPPFGSGDARRRGRPVGRPLRPRSRLSGPQRRSDVPDQQWSSALLVQPPQQVARAAESSGPSRSARWSAISRRCSAVLLPPYFILARTPSRCRRRPRMPGSCRRSLSFAVLGVTRVESAGSK